MSKSRDLGEFPAAALDIDASGNLDVTGTVTADGLTVAAGAYGTLLTAGGTNGYISVSNPSDNLVTAFTGTSDVLALGTSNTERMRLDANGAVGINYSNPSALGTVTIKQTADSKGIAIIDSTGTNTFFLENDGTQCNIRNNSASPMVFTTNLAERMRIDSAGVVTLSNTSETDTTTGRVLTVGSFGAGGGFTDWFYNPVVATLNVAGSANPVRLKVRLPVDTDAGKMVRFQIDVYSGYRQQTYTVSSYLQQATNQWASPRVTYLAGGGGTAPTEPGTTFVCGRDSDGRAYVSFLVDAYAGVAVRDLVQGWTTGDLYKSRDWSIILDATTPNAVYPVITHVYTTANAIGTVAADGSGAIIENYVSSERNVIKFADGTMIQWQFISNAVSVAITNGPSAGLYYIDKHIDLPESFFNYPSTLNTSVSIGSVTLEGCAGRSTTQARLRFISPISTTQNMYLGYYITGRWKA